MGKINQEPQIHHFSHPHPLQLFCPPHQPQLSQIAAPPAPCSGCKLPLPTAATGGAGAFIYTCTTCNFSLHVSCTQFPQLITHPAHSYHPLTLLPTSTYPAGFFNCDACNRHGNGFSYHCSQCDFDLHMLCASKPLSVTNPFHPHPLGLTFSSPYEMKGFSCDICRKIGTQQWLYRCVPCEFDVHLECVNSRPAAAVAVSPQLLQHNYSMPNVSQHQNQVLYGNQNHLQHSASTAGRLQNNYPQTAVVGQPMAVDPRYNNGGNNNVGNDLANAVVTGFVEGAAQQVGQSFMQSIIGGGGGGGGGGGDGGGGGGDSSFLSSFLGDDSSTDNY